MLLIQFKKEFKESLKDHYPEEEISTFFNILGEAYLQMDRLQIALAPQKELDRQQLKKFQAALARLKKNEPIQYITGESDFFGLKFHVNENVLIPRRETEELVEWILEDYGNKDKAVLEILDIGTGSGCIAVSLAANLPLANITAMDVSDKALETAQRNALLNKAEVRFILGDILKREKLSSSYDIIVSNPPYVRELEKKEMHPNVLENEPDQALYVKDEDPLVFYSKITKLAMAALKEGGALYFEVNQYLGLETQELMRKEGFVTELRKDIFGNDRMLKGYRKKGI